MRQSFKCGLSGLSSVNIAYIVTVFTSMPYDLDTIVWTRISYSHFSGREFAEFQIFNKLIMTSSCKESKQAESDLIICIFEAALHFNKLLFMHKLGLFSLQCFFSTFLLLTIPNPSLIQKLKGKITKNRELFGMSE